MGRLMAEQRIVPVQIVSSPAKRAAETAALVRESSAATAEITLDERIYEASPQALRQVVSELPGPSENVLLVGHNPGIEGFIRFLTGELQSMPTAALAVIDLDIEKWDELSQNCGRLIRIIRPKDEMKVLGKGG